MWIISNFVCVCFFSVRLLVFSSLRICWYVWIIAIKVVPNEISCRLSDSKYGFGNERTNYPNQKQFKVVCYWQTINFLKRTENDLAITEALNVIRLLPLFGQFFTMQSNTLLHHRFVYTHTQSLTRKRNTQQSNERFQTYTPFFLLLYSGLAICDICAVRVQRMLQNTKICWIDESFLTLRSKKECGCSRQQFETNWSSRSSDAGVLHKAYWSTH